MKKQTGDGEEEASEEEDTEENLPPKPSSSSSSAAVPTAAGSGGQGTVSPRPATPSKTHSKGNGVPPYVRTWLFLSKIVWCVRVCC